MRAIRVILIVLAAVVTTAVVTGAAFVLASQRETTRDQAVLEPFYTAPSPLPAGKPGDILRSETLTPAVSLKNANAYRVLYRTELPNGTARVSGAMLFVPTTPAPAGGRNVVSWAHPTVGMGDSCAPSRSDNPLGALDWLQGMLDQGWIVTATDYAGLGTEGVEYYLIGQNEAIDAINAVRMARNFSGAQASNKYGVFGHSQGGHTSLWAGAIGPKYAPELNLVGVAGAAPAGDLTSLVNELWDTGLAWVIGGEVLISYPAAYPALNAEQIATQAGLKNYQGVAAKCLVPGILDGKIQQALGRNTFPANPMTNPAWAAALTEQNAKPLPASVPVLVTESINDGVVVPDTIGKMQVDWCKAGSTLQVDWLGPLRGSADTLSIETHMYEGSVGGSLATSWFYQRFAGDAPVSNCNTPPLVPPAPAKK
ncbi:MAG: lipase family protein [Actinomycetes bacterium]